MTPISDLWAYSELSNHCLKTWKPLARSILAPEAAWIVFSTLNDDFLAQDKSRDLKLEPYGNEDSEYVFKSFLACL
jgi:hypothetical protein